MTASTRSALADYLRLFTEGEPTHGVRVAVGWVVPLVR
jgi:hypothetical protein